MCAQRSAGVFGLQFHVYLCPSLAARLLKKHSGVLFPAEPCVASGVLRLSGSYIDVYSFINVSFDFCLGMLSAGSGEQNLLSLHRMSSHLVFELVEWYLLCLQQE